MHNCFKRGKTLTDEELALAYDDAEVKVLHEKLGKEEFIYYMATDSYNDEDGEEWVLTHWRPTILQEGKIMYASDRDQVTLKLSTEASTELNRINKIGAGKSNKTCNKFDAKKSYQRFVWPPCWLKTSSFTKSRNLKQHLNFARKFSYVTKPECKSQK